LASTSSSVTHICFLTYLTGAAVDEVAKRSTGGDVSIVFAGVELGDVTVVAGEDWRNILNTHSICQHFSTNNSCRDSHPVSTPGLLIVSCAPTLREFKEDWPKFSEGGGVEKLQGDST